jgi:hypothetical protein
VQPAAHAQRDAVSNFRIGDRALQLQRGDQRIECVRKDGIEPIAGHLHDDAVVVLNRRSRQRIMPGECRRHPLPVLLPQLRARIDVGEKDSRDRRRVVHAKGPQDIER